MILKEQGKSFVVIMLVIAISAFVLRVSLEKIVKFSISSNESNASATLRIISVALENYAKDNRGAYPTNLSALVQGKPAYLDKDYLKQSPLMGYIQGYVYNCSRLDTLGYNCSAVPLKCGLTGKLVYKVSTAGLIISEECDKK